MSTSSAAIAVSSASVIQAAFNRLRSCLCDELLSPRSLVNDLSWRLNGISLNIFLNISVCHKYLYIGLLSHCHTTKCRTQCNE